MSHDTAAALWGPEPMRGKIALVTGASSGLGEHFATLLSRHGAKVVLVARRADRLETVAERIRSGGGVAVPISCDVTDRTAVVAAFRQAEQVLGAIPTVIVNNSGIIERIPAVDLPSESWDRVIATNLTGAFNVAQAAALAMSEKKVGGSIVNIASIVGLRVAPRVASYAASKAALLHLTKTLAYEWAPLGIRVNAIAPGYFETDLTRDLLTTERGKELVARIPMQRLGRLVELDGPLLLLASDAGTYMTGSVIAVDGGHLVTSL